MDFARRARQRSNYRNRSTKAYHNRCTNHHRRCTKARSPTPQPARADAGYASRVLRGCARAPRLAAAAQSQAGSSAPVSRPGAAPIAARLIGVWNPLWKGATAPPIKAPPRADVSTGAPLTAKMARMLAAIRMVIARSACVVNGPHSIPPCMSRKEHRQGRRRPGHVRNPSRDWKPAGGNEQMFGAKEQDPHGARSYQ